MKKDKKIKIDLSKLIIQPPIMIYENKFEPEPPSCKIEDNPTGKTALLTKS